MKLLWRSSPVCFEYRKQKGSSFRWCGLSAVCAARWRTGKPIIFDAVWLILCNLLFSDSMVKKRSRKGYSEVRLGGNEFSHSYDIFSCRDCPLGPPLWLGSGPRHVQGLQHPLVLWQTSKRVRPVLVRRLQWQQKSIWHRGRVQEDMCGSQINWYALMIYVSHIFVFYVFHTLLLYLPISWLKYWGFDTSLRSKCLGVLTFSYIFFQVAEWGHPSHICLHFEEGQLWPAIFHRVMWSFSIILRHIHVHWCSVSSPHFCLLLQDLL